MEKPTLPLELMREILLRVKSILRFKCVYKSWLSFISDPQFAISYYDLAAAPSHRLLLIINTIHAESIDIEALLSNNNKKEDSSTVVPFYLPDLNGALHWLVFCKDKKIHVVIITFDPVQRSLLEILLFDYFAEDKYEIYSLRVMGGCLCVCCSVQGYAVIEIWVMKEYKMQASWTRSVVIQTYDIPKNCFLLFIPPKMVEFLDQTLEEDWRNIMTKESCLSIANMV